MHAFARAHPFTQPEALPEATTGFSWILSLRGIRTIFFSSCENLRSGPLAPMVRGGDDREQQWQQPGKHPHLDELRKAVTAATNDSHDAIVYESTITKLEKSVNSIERYGDFLLFEARCLQTERIGNSSSPSGKRKPVDLFL